MRFCYFIYQVGKPDWMTVGQCWKCSCLSLRVHVQVLVYLMPKFDSLVNVWS